MLAAPACRAYEWRAGSDRVVMSATWTCADMMQAYAARALHYSDTLRCELYFTLR